MSEKSNVCTFCEEEQRPMDIAARSGDIVVCGDCVMEAERDPEALR